MNKKIAEYFDGLQVDLIHISQAFAVDNKSPQIEPVHIFRALLHKSAGLVNYIEDSLNPQIRNYAHHIMNWWSKSTSYPSPSFSCPVDNRQLGNNVFSLSAVLKS